MSSMRCVRFLPLKWLCGIYAICVPFIVSENPCKITQDKADCSHMKLSEIPSDLPRDIKALDLSHNQLKKIPTANLSIYNQLEELDVGYNTLHLFEPELCDSLTTLKRLNLQHNEFTKISEKYFLSCKNLNDLRLNYNGINAINGNPFENLENLSVLDMSHNKLTSTFLGDRPQMPNLKELLLFSNKIIELKEEAATFLQNTSLQKLDLSSNPIKVINQNYFRGLRSLHTLIMVDMQLGSSLVEQLCTALEDKGIQVLLLINVQMSGINNTTFKGLAATNLTSLDISKNSISHIDNDSFVYLPNLQNLTLDYNQVLLLSPYSFHGLSELKTLSLKRFFSTSKVYKIEDLSFQWLKNLEYLNVDGNRNLDLTEKTFTGLNSLKNLSMVECSINLDTITNKTFSSLSMSPLLEINLTKAGIAKLEYGSFLALGRLQRLDLGLNRIDQDLDGNEFIGLHQIQLIYLSYNNRLTLTRNSFSFVPSLQRLNLRKIKLTFREPNLSPFHGLQNLTLLDLSNNNIANLEENIFEGLSSLRILNLQHNNLARLWKNANPGGPVLFLKGLHNLEIMNLLSNGFDEIPAAAFQGLSKLRILDLGENNVYLLPKSLFDDQPSFYQLNLHKNLITSVEKELYQNVFSNIKILDMGGNPFDCTCESIAWFANWVNTTNASIPGLDTQYICNTPSNYHGVSLKHFDNSPCKDAAPFKKCFIFTFTFTVAFILVVFMIEFQGWRIQFYWNVSVNRILGFREIDPRGENFRYDAYIVHAKEDENWVENNLIILEDDEACGLKFFFEDRDMESGKPQLEAIVNSIRSSRKIIFVITHYFLNDPWCKRFKIHHAVQQAIEQSRDSIILIFLEDIPDYKLNHSIHLRKGMFTTRCILTWPAQNDRVNAFHQNLKIALGSSNLVT
uniref:Toll-like receptor 3 n=1 Tax=Leptobrachium leishanense TaxID=445787 RepID=A0A8C5LQK0_9ANUR